jgi:hypothetical protein
MTNEELLELAAKANWDNNDDVSFRFDEHEDAILYLDPANQDHNGRDVEYVWNPLTDDGDALRLAVKLSISISDDYMYPNGEHYIRVGCVYGNTLYSDLEACGNDMYAATRRAITRAAAEIGKAI